jgi:hypothetical protein
MPIFDAICGQTMYPAVATTIATSPALTASDARRTS